MREHPSLGRHCQITFEPLKTGAMYKYGCNSQTVNKKVFAKLLKLQLQVCHIWIFDLRSTVVVCSVKSTEINVIYAACLWFCGEVVALLLLGIHIYVFCLNSGSKRLLQ